MKRCTLDCRSTTILLLCAATSLLFGARAHAAPPHVFWASDPVGPNETVMLQGDSLGGKSAQVDIGRLEDTPPTAPGAAPAIAHWTRVRPIQASETTLKFVVPATWKPGVFAVQVSTGSATTAGVLLNAPDPWWIQGDEGSAATPGGWLRVLGKSLLEGERATALLQGTNGASIALQPVAANSYSLNFNLPADLVPGVYQVQVHNGAGGNAAWKPAGSLQVEPPHPTPADVFSVLEKYGPDAVAQMRKSLVKYGQPLDRTDGILAALEKAKANGGGIVYFPAGRYVVKGPLEIPPHTIVRGEGEGLVTLWWGAGHFNLDGGGPQGRVRIDEPKPPHVLIQGPDFELENLSLYLPLDYEQGIVAENRFRMRHVRIRIDHYWLVQGRGNGTVARLGKNFQVTDCDILAKGDGLVPGQFGLIARNKIAANKSNTPMGGAADLIVEENNFVSMDPTAYQNISGVGRNIYYGRNSQEALYSAQSDYSFTFDSGAGAYIGAIAKTDGTHITLANDPVYPKWAPANHRVWTHAALFIVAGKGMGQWRDLTAGQGNAWEIDRPFDVPPDSTSIASIASFNGRTLIIGNRFEDANWVNAGYGTSVDVICAENTLARCADLMNYGLHEMTYAQPSWHVQYLDNHVTEGQTHVGSSGDSRAKEIFAGPLTCWVVHRRHTLDAENSGSITLGGNMCDAIIEGCVLNYPTSEIKIDSGPRGVVVRNNHFAGTGPPRYAGDGMKNAVVEPAQ